MEAVDLDKTGTQNSHVRYEIIKVHTTHPLSLVSTPSIIGQFWHFPLNFNLFHHRRHHLELQGNYENKFRIDEESGEISVVEPLKQREGRSGRSLDEIEPVITLQVMTMMMTLTMMMTRAIMMMAMS